MIRTPNRLPIRGLGIGIQTAKISPIVRLSIRLAHYDSPTGTPTFTREKNGNDSTKGVILAFLAGFTGSILGLYLFSDAQSPSRLLPNKYNTLGVFEVRKCSSPSQESIVSSNGEHVYLKIEPPYYIAPPQLTQEQALATAAGDPFWRILSIHLKEPSLQIERPYTPLYADSISGPRGKFPIELIIKRYPDGELGRYAHRLNVGEGLELRGPHVTWQDKQVDNLILLVGGTGITPAYQLITTIFGKPDRPMPIGQRIPRISLMYAANKPSSLLLLPELAKLKEAYGNRLEIDLFVEEEEGESQKMKQSWSDWIKGKRAIQKQDGFILNQGRINEKAIQDVLKRHNSHSRRILVCGPDGMVAHIAGPKRGKQQGELSGVLAKVGCQMGEVYKL